MRITYRWLAAIWCMGASGAALVPLPSAPNLPAPGLEPNRGQSKSEILFLARGGSSIAVTADSILYSPYGARQQFVNGKTNPEVTYSDRLPGTANYYTGTAPAGRVVGVPRYATARLVGVYPGVDAEYHAGSDGVLRLRLLFAAGVDPSIVVFEVGKTELARSSTVGELTLYFGNNFRIDPRIIYPAPIAFQGSGANPIPRNARFDVQSTQRFGFLIDGRDPALPLTIELTLSAPIIFGSPAGPVFQTRGSDLFVATISPDTPGKEAPFPSTRFDGCNISVANPRACSDVALYKFNAQGQLAYVTYLAGRTSERPGFLQVAAEGSVVTAGSTDSSDFPTTAGAFQTTYAGPPATIASGGGPSVQGDLFAARLDPETGTLRAATFLGGPSGDYFGAGSVGADGSLYVFHKWLTPYSAGMPTTRGALQPSCADDPCANSYAARLSLALDQLVYGTYLPGRTGATAVLHTDGSLYYAGAARDGFPTTPNAFQRDNAGGSDAIVARLDPTGSSLIFATYIGTPDPVGGILRMAVARDGSVWADVGMPPYGLVRLSSDGQRLLVNKPIRVFDIAVDAQGNLIAKTSNATNPLAATQDALLNSSCGFGGYLKLSPSGDVLFATYLPDGIYYDFAGKSPRGLPLLQKDDQFYELDEAAPSGVYTGCVADAASFSSYYNLAPGSMITLFGSQMGPREGVAFQLEDGRLPTTLGGTRVFVNGDPIPLLYSSYWQVNAILPYTVPTDALAEIQVVRDPVPGNVTRKYIVPADGVSLFRIGDRTLPSAAAALNEDGTVNTASNPAAKGSRVVLFGTGGGPTNPASVAGEVTPLELRPLVFGVTVKMYGVPDLLVEYAGAAPGQLAGVVQINVKLPETFPQSEGFPADVAVLSVETPRQGSAGFAAVYVK